MFRLVIFFLVPLLAGQVSGPAELSQQAKSAMSAGNYGQAAGLYRKLITQLPNVGGLRMNLGLALFQQGEHRAALAELRQALKLDPTLAPAGMLAGLCHAKLGEPLQALPYLEKANAADPANPVVLLELADANYAAGRFLPAARHFEDLARRQPANPTAWRGLGLSLTSHSQQLFTRLRPESVEAITLLARAKLAAGEPKAAFSLLRKALEKDPGFGPAHGYLAELYQKNGHADWAAGEAAKAGSPTGVFAEIVDTSARALEAFGRLSALGPSPELFETEAEAAQARGAYPDAVLAWKKALEMKPGAPALERGLAKALFSGREFDSALPMLQKHGLAYEAGVSLLETGKAQEALPFLVKLRTPEGQAALGRAYLALNQPDKAIPALRAGLASDRDGSVHFQLARALQRSGSAAQAQEMDRISQQIRRAQTEQQDSLNAVQITPP